MLRWLGLVGALGACGRVNFVPQTDALDAPDPDAFVVPRALDDRTVAAGSLYTCVLDGNTPWCWGSNAQGQLGNGSIGGTNNVPAPVLGVDDAISIRASHDISDNIDGAQHACVLHANRRVSCWGRNDRGQLGDNSTATRGFPQLVPSVDDVIEVSPGGYITCALRGDGIGWCWGTNTDGQLGDGTIGGMVLTPTPLAGLDQLIDIDAGWKHTCAVRSDGTLWCWGDNTYGQLGAPLGDHSLVPRQVQGVVDVAEVNAGLETTCARTNAGQVYCWGFNNFGQLGDGTMMDRFTPAPVLGINDALTLIIAHGPACVTRPTGSISCWGFGNLGDLGNGTSNNWPMPIAVSMIGDGLEVTGGFHHGCARRASGQVWCWGQNDQGQVGDQTTMLRLTPVQVIGLP